MVAGPRFDRQVVWRAWHGGVLMSGGPLERVAIVGVGIMGAGIAAEYAASGRDVTLVARTLASAEAGLARVTAALATLDRGGLLAASLAATRERVRVETSVVTAAADADLIIESVPEDLGLKRQVFAELEAACPKRAILASNTSGLPISRIADGLAHPERVIGTHYLNPPHLMPPVEVIPGALTSSEVLETMVVLLTAMGKAPVVVRREVPGFLWNRIQFALAREAFWLVEQGVASMDEIDLVVRQGLGRRWSIAGPFASLDLGGIDTMAKVAAYLFPELSNARDVPGLLQERIAEGRYGAKTGAGFYDWPPATLDRMLARRDDALLEGLRADRQGRGGGEGATGPRS